MSATLKQPATDWWVNPHCLRVLLTALLSDCDDVAECVRVTNEVLAKPWNWHTEYVLAECRAKDRK